MLKELFKSKKRNLDMKTADWLYLSVGLISFISISLWNISKSSIWFDEAFGAYLTRFNFLDIARYTATDVHPPLYYWLLKLWTMVFGNTELAFRSMSVFFGVIAIIFGYLLVKRLFNSKIARVSLLFMILAPMVVRYSQEARMYTLTVAIAVIATYVLTIAMSSTRRLPWVIYGILISLGMWTHYFTAVVWIAHWLWRADVVRRLAGRGKFIKEFFSRQWILAHVVAVGLFLPWLPSFLHQVLVVQVSGFWIPPASVDTIPNFITEVFLYLNTTEAIGWFALGLIILIVALIVLSIKVYESLDDLWRQSYRLIMTLAFIPIILLFIMSMPPLRSLFIDRYLITSALFISIFMGITLSLGYKYLHPKIRIFIIILLPAIMIYGVFNVWYFGNYNKNSNMSSNVRQIVDIIKNKSDNNQPIIADSPWLFYEAVFYETNNHPFYFINEKTEYKITSLDMLHYNPQHKIMDIAKFTHDNPTVWYIGRPGNTEFKTPYYNWVPIQEISVNDSINNQPAYKAVQYTIK